VIAILQLIDESDFPLDQLQTFIVTNRVGEGFWRLGCDRWLSVYVSFANTENRCCFHQCLKPHWYTEKTLKLAVELSQRLQDGGRCSQSPNRVKIKPKLTHVKWSFGRR